MNPFAKLSLVATCFRFDFCRNVNPEKLKILVSKVLSWNSYVFINTISV